MLCFDLAHHIEETGLLSGLSSVAMAGAVVQHARTSLGIEQLMGEKVNVDLGSSVVGVRESYNVLWLEPGPLKDLVEARGAKIRRLAPPMTKRGTVSVRLVNEHVKRRQQRASAGDKGAEHSAKIKSHKMHVTRSSRSRNQEVVEEPVGEPGEGIQDCEIEMVDSLALALHQY